jgi:hypothetical protein
MVNQTPLETTPTKENAPELPSEDNPAENSPPHEAFFAGVHAYVFTDVKLNSESTHNDRKLQLRNILR